MKVNNVHITILNTLISMIQSIRSMYVTRNFKQQYIYVQKSTFNNFRKWSNQF